MQDYTIACRKKVDIDYHNLHELSNERVIDLDGCDPLRGIHLAKENSCPGCVDKICTKRVHLYQDTVIRMGILAHY